MTDKAPNYTDEMVASLRAGYDGSADEATRKVQVAALADELGKSAASIRAKLTREKLYVAMAKAPAGKAAVRKSELVTAIATAVDVDEDVIGSLEKATKVTLNILLKALSPV